MAPAASLAEDYVDFSTRPRLDMPPTKEEGEVDAKMVERRIRATMRRGEKELMAKHPFLKHQDAVGAVIYLASVACMYGIARLWLAGSLPTWATVPLMALPISILHELEHDLIHDMYFKHSAPIQDLMFAGILLSKLSVSPWVRRRMHLKHHRESGQHTDVEERMIGMGVPFGLKRLAIILTPLTAVITMPAVARAVPNFNWHRLRHLTAPGVLVSQFVLVMFLFPAMIPVWFWPTVRAFAVLNALPNLLRQSSLVAISSYTHYYEIPERAVYYQNMVLDHWITWPLQVFCFNFGKTHILHHYWSLQTFYVRELVSRPALDECKKSGVRFNDFGIIKRANRWYHWDSYMPSTEP